MQVLIIYDVSDKHSEIKKLLIEREYKDSIDGINGTTSLPNTTLLKNYNEKGSNCESALNDIIEVAESINVDLIRAISVEIRDWNGILRTPSVSGRED